MTKPLFQIATWCLAICLVAFLTLAIPASAQDSTTSRDDPAASFANGLRFHEGEGVAQNFATAAKWFENAASQGHAEAQNYLGRYYHTGFGVDKDQDKAVHWLTKASQTGRPQFLFDLASALENGADGSSDPTRAAELYAAAASEGHLDAIVSLGVLYQNGSGVEQDFARAHTLYLEAAEHGHPRAQNNLGLLYVRGDGVTQDYPRAVQLFSQAAEQGMKPAYSNLGVMYENGYGVAVDETRAAQLYRLGGQGAPGPDSQTGSVSIPYDQRLLPVADDDTTRELLTAMAKAGDPVAQYQLAWLLAHDPASDHATQRFTASLFRSSAEGGYGPAMVGLGILHLQGRGVLEDYVIGQMWLTLAEAAGQDSASALGPVFARTMTASQINQAQSLAADRLAQ